MESNMKLTEEQIKEILQQTQLKMEVDPQLEETIIREINSMEYYDQLIQQSKQKARIGLRASLITAIALVISLLYRLFYSPPQEAIELQSMLPSLVVIIALFMLYQLLYFSVDIRKGGNAHASPS
ncbi:MAG: hypothetical protein AAFP77_20355 [Bacteroidota bacterium]